MFYPISVIVLLLMIVANIYCIAALNGGLINYFAIVTCVASLAYCTALQRW